jgi:hypothetical protein
MASRMGFLPPLEAPRSISAIRLRRKVCDCSRRQPRLARYLGAGYLSAFPYRIENVGCIDIFNQFEAACNRRFRKNTPEAFRQTQFGRLKFLFYH